MKQLFAAVAPLVLVALGVAAGAAQRPADPDVAAKGGGASLPAGWQMRLDDPKADRSGVRFMTMAGGFHVMTGPAAIFYRTDQQKSGAYEVSATFQQMEPATHPEAYGLIIGGSGLDGADQKYTYFLVRQDGQFLIKRRAGAQTPTVADWTANKAIQKTEGTTKGTNTLAIAVAPDKVRFLVNGTEVSSAAAAQVDTNGVAGLRVNHNLNVHIDRFIVK